MALKNLKNIFSSRDNDSDDFDDIEETNMNDVEKVKITNKMILLEPRAFSEAKQIADYLKNKSSVVVSLKRVQPDVGKRIVDFLSGTLYAIGGIIQKLGGGIFLCTPKNVSVEGEITDELGKRTKKDNDDDLDNF